jgi:hypothetical protein
VKHFRTLAFYFWVLPPLVAIAVVGPFILTRGEGPMGERVAAIVLFLAFGALIQGIVYRATSRGRT